MHVLVAFRFVRFTCPTQLHAKAQLKVTDWTMGNWRGASAVFRFHHNHLCGLAVNLVYSSFPPAVENIKKERWNLQVVSSRQPSMGNLTK